MKQTRNCIILAALAILTLALPALGQDTATTLPLPGPDPFADLVGNLAARYPWLATVLAVVAACRLLLKPLFTFLHEVVKVTPSQKDDLLLARVEDSRAFRWVVFALDYLFSIRLIHPQTQSTAIQPLSGQPMVSTPIPDVKAEAPR